MTYSILSVRTCHGDPSWDPLAPGPCSAPLPWQLSASPNLTALAAAQGKPILTAQAERLQLSRVPVQALGGRKSSSGRSGFFLTAEKICPKPLHGPMGNASIILLLYTSVGNRRLLLSSSWSAELHITPPQKPKPKPKHGSHVHLTVFTYCSFCLSQLTGQRGNQVGKRGSFPGVKSPTGLHHAIAAEAKTWHRKHVSSWILCKWLHGVAGLEWESWGSEWFYRKRPE